MKNKTKVPVTITELTTFRGKYIFLFAASKGKVKAKLKMPRKDLDFLARSQSMYDAQIENGGGHFTPPFAYLVIWEKQIKAFRKVLKKNVSVLVLLNSMSR